MKTEKIIADAEMAACYLRTLLAGGLPMQPAVQITSSYVSANRLGELANQEPKPPWDQGS